MSSLNKNSKTLKSKTLSSLVSSRGNYKQKNLIEPQQEVFKVVDEEGTIRFFNSAGLRHNNGDDPAIILTNGTKQWFKNGQLHRDNDKPAVVHANGIQKWFINGELHREGDKPAVIDSDGSQFYYKHFDKHRESSNDLPAVIRADGSKEWWKNGQLHRDPCSSGDLPAVIKADGSREYWRHGLRHRDEDEPAVINFGLSKANAYWKNGMLHRDVFKGPAVIYPDGRKEWWEDGSQIKRSNIMDLPSIVK